MLRELESHKQSRIVEGERFDQMKLLSQLRSRSVDIPPSRCIYCLQEAECSNGGSRGIECDSACSTPIFTVSRRFPYAESRPTAGVMPSCGDIAEKVLGQAFC